MTDREIQRKGGEVKWNFLRLIGSIAVDTSSANEAIDETTKKAGDSGGKMSKVLTGIGNAGKKSWKYGCRYC